MSEAKKKLKIGDLLVQEGYLTEDQLKEALAAQKKDARSPLGEVCVELGFISKTDLRNILRKHQKHILLGELLVNMGILTEEQMKEILEVQKTEKKKLGRILIEKKYLTEHQLVDTLSVQLGIPKIVPDINLIDKKLLKGISSAFLLKTKSMPAFKGGDVLTVIMADPLSDDIIKDLESFFRCKIEPAIATAEDITRCINRYYQRLEFGRKDEVDVSDMKDLVIGDTDLSRPSGDSIVEVLNYIISQAIMEYASDIHIEPMERTLRVRYRIDGMLTHKTDLPMSIAQGLLTRVKVLCGLDIAEKRRHQDGRIEARVMEKEVDLRVSTYAAMWGENLVIRILHRKSTLVDLDMLGFSPANLKKFRNILDYPSGIVLVTGPTGSGKTTTLYASLQYLNKMDKMIITVEDPIEYTIEGVVQGKIDPKLGLSYMDFLKAMMRQDPDVLMIGEIRDHIAAEAAIQAALTGHQVFSTFHTDDTTGALLRLMDMGIDTFLISSTVVSVEAQRLVRKLCPKCKEKYVPGPDILGSFNLSSIDLDKYTFYKPKGCPECNNNGFKGLSGIHELLVLNDDIRDAILARKPSGTIRSIARQKARLISMREDGFYKATIGLTSLEEVVRVVFHNESDDLTPRSAEEIVNICSGKDEAYLNFRKKNPPVNHLAQPPAEAKEKTVEPKKEIPAEAEVCRIRINTEAAEKQTAKIDHLFREYIRVKQDGRAINTALLKDFEGFIIDAAKRLKDEKDAEFVEFYLQMKDNRARLFVEVLPPEEDKGAAHSKKGTYGKKGKERSL